MTVEIVINDPSHFMFDEQRLSDWIFCTTFDTRKQKRLIVDGLHKAKALTAACDESRVSIPEVTIVECVGDRVDVIFPLVYSYGNAVMHLFRKTLGHQTLLLLHLCTQILHLSIFIFELCFIFILGLSCNLLRFQPKDVM
jgi:hypothetical protein